MRQREIGLVKKFQSDTLGEMEHDSVISQSWVAQNPGYLAELLISTIPSTFF